MPLRKTLLAAMKASPIPVAGLLAALLAPAQDARASLVFDASIQTTAQGFGNAPRDLTLSSQGNNTTESGCVGVGGTGAITFGVSCAASGSVHDSNGVTNATGTGDLPSPLADDQKYGIPTAASLGITSAADIGILFNGTEPSGNSANVTDVTLKFYDASHTLVGAIDGQNNFPSTLPGNGSAGFVFRVSADELAYVNGILGGGPVTFALEATITDVAGGPESFLIFNLNAPPTGPGTGNVPEPASLALLGLGLAALGAVRARRRA